MVIIEPNIGLNTLQVFLNGLFDLVEMIERETHRQIFLKIKCEWSSSWLKIEKTLHILEIKHIYSLSLSTLLGLPNKYNVEPRFYPLKKLESDVEIISPLFSQVFFFPIKKKYEFVSHVRFHGSTKFTFFPQHDENLKKEKRQQFFGLAHK